MGMIRVGFHVQIQILGSLKLLKHGPEVLLNTCNNPLHQGRNKIPTLESPARGRKDSGNATMVFLGAHAFPKVRTVL